MNRKQIKPDIQVQPKSLSQVEFQQGNPADSDSLQQSQQLFDHLKLSVSSAIRKLGLDKRSKPLSDSQKEERPNLSEQRYYLCEYSFEGDGYCLEIPAESWKEAESRLRKISYGKVTGEIRAILPIQLGWLAKLVVWINQDARS